MREKPRNFLRKYQVLMSNPKLADNTEPLSTELVLGAPIEYRC